MTEQLNKYELKNGMVILAEPMEYVQSCAFKFMLNGGVSRIPDGCCGAGSVICDWIFRGAGDKDSRQLVDALDGLGLHRSTSINSSHISSGAALEASNLPEALKLYAEIILRPKLDADQFSLSRQLAVGEVVAIDDDPRQKVTLALNEQFYPSPFGRPAVGRLDELESLTVEKAAAIAKEQFAPSGGIFSLAGKYDFEAVCRSLEELFDTDQQTSAQQAEPGARGEKYTHIPHDGAQVHIGLMTPTVTHEDENYYNAHAAISILSGGMSSRLFTEVREKRGLCYAIGAGYNTIKHFAGIRCYAGTTPDKAQETFDVILAEFDRLSDDITDCEIHRAKIGLKTTMIMQSESTILRAGGIANDHFMLGRVRTFEEIEKRIEEISVQSVTGFLKANPFEDHTVVTIGPKEIQC